MCLFLSLWLVAHLFSFWLVESDNRSHCPAHPPSWCFVFSYVLLFYFFLGTWSEWILVVTLRLCFSGRICLSQCPGITLSLESSPLCLFHPRFSSCRQHRCGPQILRGSPLPCSTPVAGHFLAVPFSLFFLLGSFTALACHCQFFSLTSLTPFGLHAAQPGFGGHRVGSCSVSVFLSGVSVSAPFWSFLEPFPCADSAVCLQAMWLNTLPLKILLHFVVPVW